MTEDTWVECAGSRHWVNLSRASAIELIYREGGTDIILVPADNGDPILFRRTEGTASHRDATEVVKTLLRSAGVRLLLLGP